jgi:mRNA interferase RelE/StbE
VTGEPRYTLAYDPRAAKELARIDKAPAARIADAVDRLGSEPFPPGCRKLAGYDGLWRIRVQDYRVVYTVDQGKLLILALRVAHRRAVYRNL